jgi:hypothetical protein
MKRRFVVRRCDECGTLSRVVDGVEVNIDHTWSVVDRVADREICNVDTRAQARVEAAALNASGDPHAEDAHA